MHDVSEALASIAEQWRSERSERLSRRTLDAGDFAVLEEAGFHRLVVPTSRGGSWRSVTESTRQIATALRILAAGDPSPALVAAMHPAVTSFWLLNERPEAAAWSEQREAVLESAAAGVQWGTITSEPGSGGDMANTRSTASSAQLEDDIPIPGRRARITGDKHFGSGTGVCSYMLTTAIPEGDDGPAGFFLDTRELVAGRRQPGFSITAEWDGAGMSATQSHAVRLDACHAVRVEWPDDLTSMVTAAAPFNLCMFTAVIVGILDEALATARERLRPRADSLRAFEQVEWASATTEHWLAGQALDGMLDAIEEGDHAAALYAGLRGKNAVAELAERCMGRIAKVVGGGTFSKRSPFAAWFEDVRALGFLRPPWGLAHDGIYATAW